MKKEDIKIGNIVKIIKKGLSKTYYNKPLKVVKFSESGWAVFKEIPGRHYAPEWLAPALDEDILKLKKEMLG